MPASSPDQAGQGERPARVFFAIWPPLALRQRFAAVAHDLASAIGGRASVPGTLHLTLAFIGNTSAAERERLSRAASGVAAVAQPFDVTLDRLGAFQKAGVVWLGCSEPAPSLLELAAGLRAAVTQAGFTLEPRPFTPHLTLVRHSRGRLPRVEPDAASWRVDAMTLTASAPGPHGASYRDLETYPLHR